MRDDPNADSVDSDIPNPQEIRRRNRAKKRQQKENQRRAQQAKLLDSEVDVVIPGSGSQETEKTNKKKRKKKKQPLPEPSAHRLEELKRAAEMQEAIWSMQIQPVTPNKASYALSAENIETNDVSITARGTKAPPPCNLPLVRMVNENRLAESPLISRLDNANQALADNKETNEKFTKMQKSVDGWYIKYDRRLADLELAIKEQEKKTKQEIKSLRQGIVQLDMIANKNQEKRLKLEKIVNKHIPVTKPATMQIWLSQTGFDILRNILYYIAIVRDKLFQETEWIQLKEETIPG